MRSSHSRPWVSFQLNPLIVAPLFAVAVPASVVEVVGKVMVGSFPAVTVGATFPVALTVTVTVAVFVAHVLSVTVRL